MYDTQDRRFGCGHVKQAKHCEICTRKEKEKEESVSESESGGRRRT